MSDTPHVSEADYTEAVESYTGWCSHCEDFTRDTTEPDAEGYDCPVCRQNTVTGAENAMVMGLFTIDFEGGE